MTAQQHAAILQRIVGANERRGACEPSCEVAWSDDVILATQVGEPAASTADDVPAQTGLFDLVELILKRRDRLERLVRNPTRQAELLPKFLAISLIGFVFFGVAMSLVFTSAREWPQVAPIRDLLAGHGIGLAPFATFDAGETALDPWFDGSALALIAAYALGLVAATGICLPSLYFYGLLAGVQMTMLDVVLQALKAKATTAVALVGILPIYAALALGMVVFDLPAPLQQATFWLGLILPFLAGGFGTYALYQGLSGFADTLCADRRSRRSCFLRRLVLAWAACYTAITPVMIHSLWALLASGG
jgi:hypothetical protein